MGHSKRTGHGGVIPQSIRLPLLLVQCSQLGQVTISEGGPTFNLLAVPGSIIPRTSFTNWLTLGPTSPAPILITMLFGSRLESEVDAATPLEGPFRAPMCVRFFVRRLAILNNPDLKNGTSCQKKIFAELVRLYLTSWARLRIRIRTTTFQMGLHTS